MKKILSIKELKESKWPTHFQEIFGENLISCFLHGDCLIEGYDALHSPWTISFILNNDNQIQNIQKLMNNAKNENIQFKYFFTRDEIIKTLDIFPLEYLNLANRNFCLCGVKPFSGYIPKYDSLKKQCIKELYGELIHLRSECVNNKSNKQFQKYCKDSYNTLPSILSGIFFLKQNKFPENNQQIFEMFPKYNQENLIDFVENLIQNLEL